MKNTWRLMAKSIMFSLLLSAVFSPSAFAEDAAKDATVEVQQFPLPFGDRPPIDEMFADPEPTVVVQENPLPQPSQEVSKNSVFLWAFVIAVVLGSVAAKGGRKPSAKNTTVSKQYDGDA